MKSLYEKKSILKYRGSNNPYIQLPVGVVGEIVAKARPIYNHSLPRVLLPWPIVHAEPFLLLQGFVVRISGCNAAIQQRHVFLLDILPPGNELANFRAENSGA